VREEGLGVTIPEQILEEVRAVGDLVAASLAQARDGRRARNSSPTAVRLWARVAAGGAGRPRVLERSETLTPYALEAIAEDARHAGRGARLDVRVGPDAPLAVVASVRAALEPVVARGVIVHVEGGAEAPGFLVKTGS
jgi:hypothetical protein